MLVKSLRCQSRRRPTNNEAVHQRDAPHTCNRAFSDCYDAPQIPKCDAGVAESAASRSSTYNMHKHKYQLHNIWRLSLVLAVETQTGASALACEFAIDFRNGLYAPSPPIHGHFFIPPHPNAEIVSSQYRVQRYVQFNFSLREIYSKKSLHSTRQLPWSGA